MLLRVSNLVYNMLYLLTDAIRSAQQLNAVLRWFNAFDCTVKHEVTLRQRQEQTCGWFFRVQEFLDWRLALIEFIWINGKREFLAFRFRNSFFSTGKPQQEPGSLCWREYSSTRGLIVGLIQPVRLLSKSFPHR
jgi:transposase InsO family protein